MFTLTVFTILLFKGRSVLSPAQQGAMNKMVKLPPRSTVNFKRALIYSYVKNFLSIFCTGANLIFWNFWDHNFPEVHLILI